MNIKKLLLSVFAILFFTVIFLLCFHHLVGAEEISSEISTVEDDVANSIEENVAEPKGTQETVEPEEKPNQTEPQEPKDSQEEEKMTGKEIGIYIKEKILPVVIGVLTSVSALLATLVAIKRSLTSIGETKEAFKKEAKERDEHFKKESEYLNAKTEEIEKTLALVPKLQDEIVRLEENTSKLIKECTYLGKMISLGFSQNKEVVSSGNGKKISRLLEECQRLGDGNKQENEE